MVIPANPTTRFAPSPTGLLHIGHVANAIFVWGLAQRHNGRVILRMEDHDRQRSRFEYEETILTDLEWLGLKPDVGEIADFRAGRTRFRQSDQHTVYAAALSGLRERGLTFVCDCTRRTIAADAQPSRDQEPRYPGNCRHRKLTDASDRGIRVVLDTGAESFCDGLLGLQTQEPSEQCGDLLVRDRLGNWTYHWAVTHDDFVQGVDLVVRGSDLVESTGRQVRLARLLGRSEMPTFVHHPLIRDGGGRKLSKRDDDTGIWELRNSGRSPASVLGRAAHLVGLLDRPEDVPASELRLLFDTEEWGAVEDPLTD